MTSALLWYEYGVITRDWKITAELWVGKFEAAMWGNVMIQYGHSLPET